MSRTLLIDADLYAYHASAGTEKVFYFDGEASDPSVEENLEAALVVAEREIEAIAKRLKADKVIVCLTDDVDVESGVVNNFRVDCYPQYKQNRLKSRKPSTLARVKEFYSERYECYQRPRLEADDCMGILSTHKILVPGEKVIVSGDKDMQTIPGLLFNPKKDKAVRRITALEADRYFMYQSLIGDPTDGYPGCKGIGPKSKYAQAVLEADSLDAMWQHVLDGYASKGRTPEEALSQARCARILRSCDWDFAAKKPRLWTPPVAS